MAVYYIEVYPLNEILKWEDGKLTIESMLNNEATSITLFVDKLLINEQMDYINECIPEIKKINKFVSDYRSMNYSLNSSCL